MFLFLYQLFKSDYATFDLSKYIPILNDINNQIINLYQIKNFVLLLQAGYLMIAKIGAKIGNKPLHLPLPNMEVTASLAPLLLSVEPPNDP
jgi:hypothetical protein